MFWAYFICGIIGIMLIVMTVSKDFEDFNLSNGVKVVMRIIGAFFLGIAVTLLIVN